MAVRRLRFFAPVAQLDRAPGFEPVGRRFESCRARLQNMEYWEIGVLEYRALIHLNSISYPTLHYFISPFFLGL
jgi:hypothetical protein